ncbi:hypothetical protein RF11_03569 [Thelohanellus kitauei]|uniref:Uncharacterized protein n=1 Tax=Thelohanellus kitauei TaxID=669202 RepID=A0A0C2MLY5_THEKT|nr:hypothetical protein RF11_03569 [Thelohanellus kitauei]
MDSDSVENMSHLKPCLSENGSIKATDDVSALIESMQKLKSVSGRSLVVNILKSTAIFSARKDDTKEVLKRYITFYSKLLTRITFRFISQGGWDLLGTWFSEAIEAKHYTFLTHFVESLKVIAKFDCKPLQLASRRLLVTWKKYVKDINQKNKSERAANNNRQATFLDSLTAAIVPHQKSRKRTLVIKSEDESTPTPDPPETVTENQFESVNETDDKPVMEIPEETVNEMNDPTPKKRRVSFREDDLVQVFTFEMTDQERAGTKCVLNRNAWGTASFRL